MRERATMKVARIHKFGPPDVLAVEEIPQPTPGPGELLIRVEAQEWAPWDALIREHKSEVLSPLPLTLGSDLAGTVEKTGSGVSEFKVGDEIYGVTNPPVYRSVCGIRHRGCQHGCAKTTGHE
jgi:NADPH:quinone reductase-like Zn-dependent oxidoreductase